MLSLFQIYINKNFRRKMNNIYMKEIDPIIRGQIKSDSCENKFHIFFFRYIMIDNQTKTKPKDSVN